MTQKVIQRLIYEHLLIATGVPPRRTRITLDDMLEAAKEEPRIYEVLPAVILYKPRVIKGLEKDLKRHPRIPAFVDTLFTSKFSENDFFGIPREDCLKAAQTYERFIEGRRTRQKSKTLTLRLSSEDMDRLRSLASKLRVRGISETIRRLALEKERNLDYERRLWSLPF